MSALVNSETTSSQILFKLTASQSDSGCLLALKLERLVVIREYTLNKHLIDFGALFLEGGTDFGLTNS